MSQLILSRRPAGSRMVAACVSVMLAVVVLGLTCHAERYMVGDLQLIGWESVPKADSSWSGPVEAATILAWYAAHGYSWILPDLNDDGFIDEQDTAGLAGILGREFMEADTTLGTTDSALVWGIGAYLAEVAGGWFGMRVYDAGFAHEWQDQPPSGFRPDEIPGVAVDAWDDPSLADYGAEMAAGALTILGLTRGDDQPNVYVAGRSVNDGFEESAVTGVGFVSSQDDPCRAGIQGRVVDTLGKSTTAWWIRVDGVWYEVEFMLALWETEPESAAAAASAPDLAASVESSSSCEDSGQENGVSCTIQWTTTISNNNPEYRVPRAFKVEQRIDLASESTAHPTFQYLPAYVDGGLLRELNETGSISIVQAFVWETDLDEALNGEYALSVLADARCEIDEFTPLAEANNDATAGGELSRQAGDNESGTPQDTDLPDIGDTPLPPAEGCVDLSVEIVDTSCVQESSGFHTLDVDYTVEMSVKVTNLGTADAGSFWVWANGTDGVDVQTVSGLAAGESVLVDLSYSYTLNMTGVSDVVKVTVDAVRSVDCNASNNSASVVVCD
ncbi:CARDB domain-containing protein [Candidatus Bipolaricaulota bacterium]